MRETTRLMLVLVAVLGTIGCDQATKYAASRMLVDAPDQSYVADVIRLAYAENAGGFLSLGADLPKPLRTLVFTVTTGMLLVALLAFGVRHRVRGRSALGLALFIAGGISNLIDRILRGTVIDFLNVGVGQLRTGVFNVADVAIMVGAALLAFDTLRERQDRSSPHGE